MHGQVEAGFYCTRSNSRSQLLRRWTSSFRVISISPRTRPSASSRHVCSHFNPSRSPQQYVLPQERSLQCNRPLQCLSPVMRRRLPSSAKTNAEWIIVRHRRSKRATHQPTTYAQAAHPATVVRLSCPPVQLRVSILAQDPASFTYHRSWSAYD